ncbi:MAG: hypothetical protein RLZZ98_741 [Pseudomonadota bacterium]|jgi:hypothetical protein
MLRNRKSRALLGFFVMFAKHNLLRPWRVSGLIDQQDRMGLVRQARKGLPQSPNRRGCVRGIYPLKRIILTPKKSPRKTRANVELNYRELL